MMVRKADHNSEIQSVAVAAWLGMGAMACHSSELSGTSGEKRGLNPLVL